MITILTVGLEMTLLVVVQERMSLLVVMVMIRSMAGMELMKLIMLAHILTLPLLNNLGPT